MKRIREWEFLKLDMITSVLCLLPILFGLLVYGQLPAEMPVHFGVNGPDGYASKAFAVFGAPVLLMLVQMVMCVLLELDIKKKNASRKMRIVSRFILPVCSMLVETMSIMTALKRPVNVVLVMNLFMGFLFLILGNLLPKCKYNYTIGIRLVTTLGSEENWNKTHRLAGFVWVIGSLVMIAMTFLKVYAFTWVPLVFMVAIPIIYSIIYAVTQRGKVKSE